MKLNPISNATPRITNPILSGLFYTYAVVIIATLIWALLLYFTSLSDTNLSLFSYTITAISLLFGGFISGKRAGSRGWYYGGMTGAIYGIILAIIGFLGFDSSLNLRNLVLIILAFLFGALGGIFGVNSRK